MLIWETFTKGWLPTDKIALVALGVAAASFLLSFVPAITSVFQAIAAWHTRKMERESREPAINVSIMVPNHWPKGYIELHISVKNRSDYFIEIRRFRLRSPRNLGIALLKLPIAFPLPPSAPVDPTSLHYSKTVSAHDTLVRPVGSKNLIQGTGAEETGDTVAFSVALLAPVGRWQDDLLVKLQVDVARSNRHVKPTAVPLSFKVEKRYWTDHRT